MNISKIKINLLLISSAFFIVLIIVLVDDNNLNSLVINYDDNLIINEIDTYKDEEENVSDEVGVLLSNKVASDNWVFPVDGNYIITTYYSYSHRAIDIYSYNGYGSNIKAANNGEVITAVQGCVAGDVSCNGRRGNYVVIRHNKNNYYTVYMHLANISVRVGDVVSAGQVIGSMGNTGHVIPVPTSSNPYGGTHLHFCLFVGEPYNGGYAVNPFNLY